MSSRDWGLLFLPDLESNPWSFLQTSHEALLPLGHSMGSKRYLSRRGLGFLWGHRGSGVCLGSWGGRYALGTSLCSGCHGRGRGPFRQRGRPPDTPTCLRAQPASSGRNGFFRTPAICSGAPGKKSFHSFHSNPTERQCQRMLKLPHNCTHLTR